MNQPQPLSAAHQLPPILTPPRIAGQVLLKLLLCLGGVCIAEISGLGGTLTITGSNMAGGCIALFGGLCGLGTSLFIFFSQRYYRHCLPWLQYLWWVAGTTGACLILLIILFAFTNPNTTLLASIFLCFVFCLYGICLIWIAYRKPPISQQINESVYWIVRAMPGKQIALMELLSRLQREYRQIDRPLQQYIVALIYLEQIPTPGGILCRIKQQPKPVPVPRMIPVTANMPYQRIERPHITPQVVQSKPAHSFESQNARAFLADQQTVPMLPAIKPIQQVPPSPLMQSNKKALTSPPDIPAISTAKELSQIKVASSSPKQQQTINICCCYAHKDEHLLKQLKSHLQPQLRQGNLHIWYDRDISAGLSWEQEIEIQIDTAQIILLLISADFMASDYCYTKEMERALDRQRHGEVQVIPIILRPTDWQITPLGTLQALPRDGKPITTWSSRDSAYVDVVQGIRVAIEQLNHATTQPVKQERRREDVSLDNAEAILIRTRCKQGALIVTTKKITIELRGLGLTIKSQTLLRSSLSSMDSKLAIAPILGAGGGMHLTFRGKGKEVLYAELVPIKEAKEIVTLLS